MKKITSLAALMLCVGLTSMAQDGYVSDVWCADQGDGTYRNPVLYADYSDPDVCRVGDDFYLTSSSFNCLPGLQLLHSRDLVNWEIVGAAIPWTFPVYDDTKSEADVKPPHGRHVWAPSIRYHRGRYYIFWGDPDEGVYQVNAERPEGPWTEPVLVKEARGVIDTCPLWDDDGRVYLVHAYADSRAGFKSVISVCELNADATKAITPSRVVYDGHSLDPTCEGPKFYKKDGYYYIFHPAGGVQTGWQVVQRSTNVYGPYERRVVLAQGQTEVNGPHQGAWVTTNTGEDWFLHFQDVGPLGRLVHLQPMRWVDGWPVIGTDADGDGCGEPVMTYRKPNVGRSYPVCNPVESDDFDGLTLGGQWQWQGNFDERWHYCAADKSMLRLYASPVPEDYVSLWDCRNVLLQKPSAPQFTCTVKMTFCPSDKYVGERCGLVVMGMDYAALVLTNTSEGISLSEVQCLGADKGSHESVNEAVKLAYDVQKDEKAGVVSKLLGKNRQTLPQTTVWLRCTYTQDGVQPDDANSQKVMVEFSYSTDGSHFKLIGTPFAARQGKWIGCKTGLFCNRPAREKNDGGWCDVDYFLVSANDVADDVMNEMGHGLRILKKKVTTLGNRLLQGSALN